MKKVLSLILALVMCLSLCACGKGSQDAQSQMPNIFETSPTLGGTCNDNTPPTEEPLIILDPKEGYYLINESRFDELTETVELTTENWMEYLEVWSYTQETVQKDAFGEIVSIETCTSYYLVAKGDQYYMFNDFVIELKHKTTGTLTICRGEDYNGLIVYSSTERVPEDFCLDEYECTRIKGTLSFVDIPDEVITVSPHTGARVYRVGCIDKSVDYNLLYSEYTFGPDGRLCGFPY